KCFEILLISGVLNRGEYPLQQLAHLRQSIFSKASSCRPGNCLSTLFLSALFRYCLYSLRLSPDFFSQLCRMSCGIMRKLCNLPASGWFLHKQPYPGRVFYSIGAMFKMTYRNL